MPLFEDSSDRSESSDPLEPARRHYERGDFGAAVRELQTLIQQRPGDHSAHAVLALCLHRMGRPVEGDRSLGKALRIAPRDPMVNVIAGHLCLETERYDRAEDHLLTALDVQPGDDDSMRLLAMTH